MSHIIYEVHKVTHHPIEDHEDSFHHTPDRSASVMEILKMIGHRSLKDQIYMICNILTVSGFTQAEIAEVLGVEHQTYRNHLLKVRKEMKGQIHLK